ncbi:protein of unknown function (DUF4160) [endosymbiont DhMRE of Dentiscutata heterogama]|uniref:DUF2442 domain-containing protein n=1 Tax=endosymbiont DhMRE of Dentiscutata heterogama TaxID=1609546 RepID=UPI000629D892|nr:DUF2442 domain-containing protein [endosymbiont DhMRE of Dentiscutata heterogama]CFW92963.1 protein of unknown function (DUF4160) [endosymbiont DhMRE of Dentiscutata heterogama]
MVDKKKQIRMASGKGEYVTKVEFFQELKEIRNLVKDEYSQIKNDIKEVKKAVITPNQNKKEVKKEDTKIINLEVQKDKLIAQLSDGRELSIPIVWFKKWGVKGVKVDKLKNYEIWEGDEIYFPDIDEVLGIESFTKGFDADCE